MKKEKLLFKMTPGSIFVVLSILCFIGSFSGVYFEIVYIVESDIFSFLARVLWGPLFVLFFFAFFSHYGYYFLFTMNSMKIESLLKAC